MRDGLNFVCFFVGVFSFFVEEVGSDEVIKVSVIFFLNLVLRRNVVLVLGVRFGYRGDYGLELVCLSFRG